MCVLTTVVVIIRIVIVVVVVIVIIIVVVVVIVIIIVVAVAVVAVVVVVVVVFGGGGGGVNLAMSPTTILHHLALIRGQHPPVRLSRVIGRHQPLQHSHGLATASIRHIRLLFRALTHTKQRLLNHSRGP